MVMAEMENLTLKLAGASVSEGVLSFAGHAIKMDKGSDAQEIVKAVTDCKELHVLILSGNTMGVEAANLIGDALSNHKEFQRAKWSDMFTGRLKTEIPPALQHLGKGIMASGANLVELDLSDNAFGPIGVQGIADLLKHSCCFSLEELRLNNNGLGPNGGKMLAEVLESTYQSSKQAGKALALKVFVSGRGRLENEGSIALSEIFKKMGSLEFVSMPQNGINPPGITALAQAFALNTRLKHINLCDNTFTSVGARAMAKALPKLQELEILNLESCLIRTGGAKAIAKALDNSYPKLKEIMCNFNEINKAGAVAIAETAALIPSLETLQLDGNCLGEEGQELVMTTLEAAGRTAIISGFDEDEGTEDEDEEEEEVEEEEVEADGSTQSKVTPKEFIESPTQEAMAGLSRSEWLEFAKGELSAIPDVSEIADRALYLCMRMSSPLNTVHRADTKQKICSLCDDTLKLLASHNPSDSVLCNSVLVNIGLIKSENKKFRVASEDLTGPLTLIQHIVKQDYVSKSSRKVLHSYLTKSEKKLEKYFQVKFQLLQTLFSLQ